METFLNLIVLLAFSIRIGIAQPSGTREGVAPGRLLGDVMFEKYLAQEAARLSDRFLDGAKTLEEWKDKRPRLRQEFLAMIGLWPLPEKTPLSAIVTQGILRRPLKLEVQAQVLLVEIKPPQQLVGKRINSWPRAESP